MTWLEAAVEEFDRTGFKDGDLISKDWLIFALQVPTKGEDVDKIMFMFMNRFIAFRDYLLLGRKIAIENVRGKGYRIVPPNEQAQLAADEALKLIRKGLTKGETIAANTRVNELTNDEAARHTDMQIKLAGLAQMMGRQKKDILGMAQKHLTNG